MTYRFVPLQTSSSEADLNLIPDKTGIHSAVTNDDVELGETRGQIATPLHRLNKTHLQATAWTIAYAARLQENRTASQADSTTETPQAG